MGLIYVSDMQVMIHRLSGGLDSTYFCRALYLLLLRSSRHLGAPLEEDFLLSFRLDIVIKGNAATNNTIRRWLIVSFLLDACLVLFN